MRVGLLIYGDLDSLSGGYLYDRRLVASLQQQGDTVQIISLPHRPYLQELCSRHDIASLIHGNLDVLIQDELVHPSVVRINPGLRRQTGIPVVGLVHLWASFANQPIYKSWLYRQTERRYIKSVDGLVLNSRNSLAQATRLVGSDRLPPHVIAVPAGNNFQALSLPTSVTPPPLSGPLMLLYAGNVIRQKGLHILLQALRQLPSENFQLTVAGRLDMEPAYVKSIQATIRQLRLQDQVTLAGPLNHQQMLRMYKTHHVFVLPSVNEAYGIVYVEAQQFGMPVIGTTSGGAGEIISHGDNGYLIKPGDSTSLANLLRTLHSDRDLLQRLGANAIQAYQRHPVWEDTGRTIRSFLIDLISRKGDRH